MTASSAAARAAAARAIDGVRRHGRSLDDSLAQATSDLTESARPLAAALAYGALRYYRQLDGLLDQLLDRPLPKRESLVHALLMAALLDRWQHDTPAHAAVAEAVNACVALGKSRLKGLVNAVLRRFGRERETLIAALSDSRSVRHNYPDWFVEVVAADWPDDADDVLAAGNARAPMWLRVNLDRTTREAYTAELEALGLESSPSPDCPSALQLHAPVPVTRLPGFDAGAVSVQDVAAQAVAAAVDVAPGMRVLDACAAPGGKTGHLLECAGGALDLVALDSDADRLARVRETLDRLDYVAQCVAADAGRPDDWWDGKPFDRILIDAPCSGSGVVRRHPDIKVLRRRDDLEAFARRQSDLLQGLWPLLAPGGCLVYATCSIFRIENHNVVSAFCDKQAGVRGNNELRVGNINGVMRTESLGLQRLPGGDDGDGFFFSILHKDGG
ncbi:MAG: 16S rRNA (cytosine(967)-C(5))-methyltransferase RsmB [Pseudomonadota bacterium]